MAAPFPGPWLWAATAAPAPPTPPLAAPTRGRVAVTRDFLPHLHEPAPGLLVDIGCMGPGIGLQTSLGKALAGYLGSGRAGELPLPIAPLEPIPAHALKRLFVSAVIA